MDPFAALLGSDPTAEERAAELAKQLRRQQFMGLVAQGLPNQAMQGVGKSIVDTAQTEQQALNDQTTLPMRRLKLALEAQRLDLGNRREANIDEQRDNLSTYRQGMLEVAKDRANTYRTKPAGGMGHGGSPISLTPEALDQAAAWYVKTGSLPQLGSGMASSPARAAIVNRAAQIAGGEDLASNVASFKADQGSLSAMQKQADATEAFEKTALANLDQFLTAAKGVVDTGSPLFNASGRKFAETVAGDPKMTAFNTARQVAVQEVSKVLSGAMGNAAVSDSARHEASELLKPDASLAQIEKAAQILKTDMANRKRTYDEHLGTIRSRIGAKKGAAAAPAAAPVVAAPPTARVRFKGKLLEIPREKLAAAVADGAEEVK